MATGESIAGWVDADTKREAERFMEINDYDSMSEAAGDLIKIGLRESSNPLIFRVKDRVVDWVSLLGIAAVIVFLAGASTNVIALVDAAKLSVSMVSVAVVLLGAFELARLVMGMNELGSALRDVFSGEKA